MGLVFLEAADMIPAVLKEGNISSTATALTPTTATVTSTSSAVRVSVWICPQWWSTFSFIAVLTFIRLC